MPVLPMSIEKFARLVHGTLQVCVSSSRVRAVCTCATRSMIFVRQYASSSFTRTVQSPSSAFPSLRHDLQSTHNIKRSQHPHVDYRQPRRRPGSLRSTPEWSF